MIIPESPVTPMDVVSIQLTGNFSDSGAGVDDYNISLVGTTVNLEINASSDGGLAVLTPFDLTYELGMYEVGEYTVEIVGSGVSVSVDEVLTFVVEGVDDLGVDPNQSDELGILIYPNPTVDFININFEKWETNNRVEILSSESKIVLNEWINSKTTELKISHLENGVYFVRLLNAEGLAIKTERIVIAR